MLEVNFEREVLHLLSERYENAQLDRAIQIMLTLSLDCRQYVNASDLISDINNIMNHA